MPHSDIHGSTPARGSPWLFAACHVLHRLLVPRHPPNALLILDIPAFSVRRKPHHAQKPSSGQWSVVRRQRSETTGTETFDCLWTVLEICVFRTPGTRHGGMHNRIFSNGRFAPSRMQWGKDPSGQIVHNASEPSPPAVGALPSGRECFHSRGARQQFPVRHRDHHGLPPIFKPCGQNVTGGRCFKRTPKERAQRRTRT